MAPHGRHDERYAITSFHIGDDLIHQDGKMGYSPASHTYGNTLAMKVGGKEQKLQFLPCGSAHILQAGGRETLPDACH
ncbi:MAG TPA: hypothetical protein DHV46_03160 [Desulfovibrio piger]|uniref:Uncharacterized protein n=1 Tax=Desulfovibrio piger ATCC 29098 TaxID=411464 RepID=B6WW12_9BACT|nr:hypothetical protein DESPIG_02281 [Desulfovibrio piger ATCC 29098]HCZ43556.1 hypothetical protein [Desulfovibrio piger]